MPGSSHRLPYGAKCDNHSDRLAIVRLQGETDSMGAELNDYCGECRDAVLRDLHNPKAGLCDLCNQVKDDLAKWRDPDEGVAGRVYDACKGCRDHTARFYRDADAENGVSFDPEEAQLRETIASMGEDPHSPAGDSRQPRLLPQSDMPYDVFTLPPEDGEEDEDGL